jgi:SulP family sulfate permease
VIRKLTFHASHFAFRASRFTLHGSRCKSPLQGGNVNRLALSRKTLGADLVAGVVNAVTSIPDGMASAMLAGLNPIQGLYCLMIGTPVAALVTGSVFMNVSVTSAMALAVGDSLVGYSGEALLDAVIVLTVLVGVVALVLGLLKLGTLTRFISNAVMVGFLTGIAALIILGQLGDLTGYQSEYSNKVLQSVDLLLHLNAIDVQTTVTGILAIAIMVLLDRTPLKNFAMIVAMVVGSALVLLLGWDSVQLVRDVAEIPRSLPTPRLPDLSLVPALIGPAIAVAVIGLSQGAGVGRSIPNPDGDYGDPSRDFGGQGLANIAAGIFQGMPIGGSLSATAINVNAGARTRWANIFAGIFVALFVLLLAGWIELVAMPTVAALLIVAGWQTLDFEEMADVRDAGMGPRLIMIVTFLVTLVVRIHVAVFFGVLVSLLHFVYTAAMTIRMVEIVRREDGALVEQPPPTELPSKQVTVLHPYGTLYFAAVYTLEKMLPSPLGARRAVVILRLRGYEGLGSTFVGVLERYAARLRASGGKLLLSGVSESTLKLLQKTETTDAIPERDIFLAEARLGASTRRALEAAEAWLGEKEAGSA